MASVLEFAMQVPGLTALTEDRRLLEVAAAGAEEKAVTAEKMEAEAVEVVEAAEANFSRIIQLHEPPC